MTVRSPSRSPLLLAPLLPAAFAAGSCHADAAPAYAPPLLAAVDTVVVSGSRVATRLDETPLAIAQLPAEAIAARQPAFIGEVVNTVPGVYMTDLGNEQHNMSIRQPLSYSPYYLYLEDGIPIRPLGLFNHNALYEVNLDGSERIEIIKGPASSLYGSNSVGGTINFIGAAPSRTFSARVGGQVSDQGYWRGDFDVSNSADDVGGRLAGYVSRRNGGWQDHNDAEKEALTARGDWQATPATLVRGTLAYNHLRTDMPGTLYASDYRARPDFSYHHFTFREVSATRATLVVEGDWLAAGGTTLTLYARDNSTEQLPNYLIFNTGPATASGRHNDNDFTSLGTDARQVLEFDWLRGRLVAGATIERTDNEYDEDNLSVARDPTSGAYLDYDELGRRRDYRVQLDNHALYAQYEATPATDWRAVFGARYDSIEYDFRNHLAPGSATGAPSETRDFEHLSPKAGLIWSPTPAHSLYANWSQGFAPPEVSALYSSLAVPNLKESVFDNYELGWRGTFLDERLHLDVALYRLTGRDEVVSYSIVPGQSESRNAGRTLHQGVEFGIDWRIGDDWQLALSAARSHHEFREYRAAPNLDYAGNDMPAAPEWLANTELRWTPGALPGFSAALEWVHMGRYWLDNANNVRYPGHDLANLRLAWRIAAWEFWIKGQNLGNVHYAEIAASTYNGIGAHNPDTQDTYTPGAPRTTTIGFNYRLGAAR